MIYENTPESDRTLREIIAKSASENIDKLLDRGEFVDLLKSHGSLAADVLKEVVTPKNQKSLQMICGGFPRRRRRGRFVRVS
jgi:hypothetical protein